MEIILSVWKLKNKNVLVLKWYDGGNCASAALPTSSALLLLLRQPPETRLSLLLRFFEKVLNCCVSCKGACCACAVIPWKQQSPIGPPTSGMNIGIQWNPLIINPPIINPPKRKFLRLWIKVGLPYGTLHVKSNGYYKFLV